MSGKLRESELAQEILDCMLSALGPSIHKRPMPLHEPFLEENARREVGLTLESGFVSSVGPTVQEFERLLCELSGVKNSVSTSSGTSALQLALKVVGVEPGDHVVVPAMSFMATANAVSFLGAAPVFVDSVKLRAGPSLGICPESLEELLRDYSKGPEGPLHKGTGAKISAIVPMHALGRLCDLRVIRRMAADWKIPIVEDAAEALGSFSTDGAHPGFSDVAILSFNGNKTITTGGGGALLTNSDEFADKARHLSTTAKIAHPWRFSHDAVGWNFRMPALNAALGVAQMQSLPKILDAKRLLYDRYKEAFSNSKFFEFLDNPADQQPNNWLIAVKLRSPDLGSLDQALDGTHSIGIQCRPVWDLLPDQLPYRHNTAVALPNAREIRNSVLCLPSSPGLILNQ
jgi:perosamine synthetase